MTRNGIRQIKRAKLGLVGLVLVGLALVSALLAPAIAPSPPNRVTLASRLVPPLARDEGGVRHVLGTDQLGRDILARIVFGTRVSLAVGLTTVFCAGTVGFGVGVLAGYRGGLVDAAVMRAVDLQLAFPFLLLALAIVALLGPSLVNIVVVFVITSWPVYARTARAAVLVVRAQEYIAAAQSMGAEATRILLRHVVPNVLGPMLVVASFEMARVIIVEAAMGFLGLGVRPPTPTWGNMLADGRAYIRDAWWLSAFPGAAIMLLAAGVNFVGDALRDSLDPRLR